MNRTKGRILWADDEIDHLKPHILFLEERGYFVTPVTNAEDAVALAAKDRFDLVLLDERMPGIDGLEALRRLKAANPLLPVIMITKSEEENLMEQAIGGQIEDYLTKPVNPSQILSSCKRILEKKRISHERMTQQTISEFGEIATLLEGPMDVKKWMYIYEKLSEREVNLDGHSDQGFRQTLADQRKECNQAFGKFVEEHYPKWVKGNDRPVLSVDFFSAFVLPRLKQGIRVFFIVIDNLRLDQWLVIESLLYSMFEIEREYYLSILPTATPYSRNSLFAGLFPSEIAKRFPDLWNMGEKDETSRNRFEQQFLQDQLKRRAFVLKPEPKYIKILDAEEAKAALRVVESRMEFQLAALVFNFVDILAHRRSDSQILREMLPDEAAYRSLTRTWFEHSTLFQILKTLSSMECEVIITSDHGSVRSMRGTTVFADRETSTNLRYKYGKGIRADLKHVIEVRDPRSFGLPAIGLNYNYLIAREDYYFVYPTNYHHYLALYRDSLQHGGVSLEEMVLPVAILKPKAS